MDFIIYKEILLHSVVFLSITILGTNFVVLI